MTVLPAKMKAIEIRDFGPPEGLQLTDRVRPTPNENEVLIKVAVAGVNRPDVMLGLGG